MTESPGPEDRATNDREGGRELRGGRLDRESKDPLWLQLVGILKDSIDHGLLRADQALPSESELIDRYGVSRTVVREALAELVRRGLIYKIRAKGSFVAPPRKGVSFVGSTLGSSDDLIAAGRSVATQVLSLDEGTATESEAAALRVEPGSDVIRMRRLRTVDGTPWLLVETTLPKDRFAGLLKVNFENRSLYEHLRRHYGITPAGADRWLQAIIPSVEDGALLQLDAGAPVLHIESVAWDADETPFEFYHALHRSDESRFYLGVR
jgi:GntR family transcriptional regulator